jgi:hypothetical protein
MLMDTLDVHRHALTLLCSLTTWVLSSMIRGSSQEMATILFLAYVKCNREGKQSGGW